MKNLFTGLINLTKASLNLTHPFGTIGMVFVWLGLAVVAGLFAHAFFLPLALGLAYYAGYKQLTLKDVDDVISRLTKPEEKPKQGPIDAAKIRNPIARRPETIFRADRHTGRAA